MKQIPLRLGSSTSCLCRCVPDDFIATIHKSKVYSPEESKRLRSIAKSCGEAIGRSQIRSLECFLTVAMLDLGLDNPMLEMFRHIGDHCEVWSVHAPFSGVDMASPDDELRKQSVQWVSEAAKIGYGLGAKVLTVHSALEVPVDITREQRVRLAADSIAKVADVCGGLGIRVAVEILPRQCIGNKVPELMTMLELIDRPNVGACLDSNHSFPARELGDVVRTLGPLLTTLHISDHDDVDERHWLPGKGVIDWTAFIRTLREVKYTGPFVYEVTMTDPGISEAIATLERNYHGLMEAAG
ncbi:MAG: sugar phosphate isomerase/epimerase [Armatimonadetes bacterium]|nr:sugar phosphate isomerase/epimerase [Armatimonadota bacterium]